MLKTTSFCRAGLALTCFVLGAAAVPAAAPADAETRGNAGPVARIPVEIVDNHIFLKVAVNGSAPLDFVLDTGATDYGIERRTADALGIRSKPLGELSDVGTGDGEPEIGVASDVTFRLGGITLARKVAYVVSFGDLDERAGHRIDGVIGADLFARYVVEIDYGQSRVTLYEPARYRHAGSAERIPLTLVEGRPFVLGRLEIGGRPVETRLLIDTGDGDALALHTPFVEAHSLPRAGQPVLVDAAYGIAGRSGQLLARADRLGIGRFSLERPVVGLGQSASGTLADPSFDGSIGGEVLRRFRVVFDYSRSRVHLERGAKFGDAFEADSSGVKLRARRPAFTSIEVDGVAEPSPASEAGLRTGDRLIALDGRRGVSLEDYEATFRKPGRVFDLLVERAGSGFRTKLVTRRRI